MKLFTSDLRRAFVALVALVALVACAPGDAPDSGPPPDGDAGDADAGGPPLDGGRADAGAPDAGVDAGPLFYDAGPPPPDADAGPAANGYWAGVDDGLTGQALVNALHTRLSETHVELGYGELYAAYLTTDSPRGSCTSGIFDFYSTRCWAEGEQCGNYNSEGDCFNREHSWPKSWWGSSESIAPFTDLFHVIPADGYVNNARGNFPLGEVGNATYTSTNNSRVGPCTSAGYSGNCFEPRDDLKGGPRSLLLLRGCAVRRRVRVLRQRRRGRR